MCSSGSSRSSGGKHSSRRAPACARSQASSTKKEKAMLTWYLPSFYGDIRLESQGDSRTMLTLHGLTPEEEHAMQILLERAKGGALKKSWATPEALAELNLRKTTVEQKLLLTAPISDVQKVLAKALRPGKKKLSVVRFSGGKIEEVTEATQGLIQASSSD